MSAYILAINQIHEDDASLVGYHNANLSNLHRIKLPTPSSFCLTTSAYQYFLDYNHLTSRILDLIFGLNPLHPDELKERSRQLRSTILRADFPAELTHSIIEHYHYLTKDGPVALKTSYLNQQHPYHHYVYDQVVFTKGDANLLNHIKTAYADSFSPSNLIRALNHANIHELLPSVLIQSLVDPIVSGKLHTHDQSLPKKHQLVTAIYGFSNQKHPITPNSYWINNYPLYIDKKEINIQKTVFRLHHLEPKLENLTKKNQNEPKLTDGQILELGEIGKLLRRHYYYPATVSYIYNHQGFFFYNFTPSTLHF